MLFMVAIPSSLQAVKIPAGLRHIPENPFLDFLLDLFLPKKLDKRPSFVNPVTVGRLPTPPLLHCDGRLV